MYVLRRLPAATVVAATLVLTLVIPAAPVSAQSDGTGTTTPTTQAEIPHIIPRPNSGTEPTDAGDRGGWLQGAIFFVICAGVVVIGALVVRESRRARAGRGF